MNVQDSASKTTHPKSRLWIKTHSVNTSIHLRGSTGSLHISTFRPKENIDGSIDTNSVHVYKDGTVISSVNDGTEIRTDTFKVSTSGILQDVKVVDTTGAGDAFIGGYLMSKLGSNGPEQSTASDHLAFGAWVGGRKVEGPGARSTLPTGTQVDDALGKNTDDIKQSLKQILGPFGLGADSEV